MQQPILFTLQHTSGVQDPVLESNPAGYLNFFGFGLDIASLSTGSDPVYPNEIRCGHAKTLDVE